MSGPRFQKHQRVVMLTGSCRTLMGTVRFIEEKQSISGQTYYLYQIQANLQKRWRTKREDDLFDEALDGSQQDVAGSGSCSGSFSQADWA